MAPRPHTAFVVSNFDQEIFRKRPTVHLSSEKANSARFAMSPIPLHGRLFHIRAFLLLVLLPLFLSGLEDDIFYFTSFNNVSEWADVYSTCDINFTYQYRFEKVTYLHFSNADGYAPPSPAPDENWTPLFLSLDVQNLPNTLSPIEINHKDTHCMVESTKRNCLNFDPHTQNESVLMIYNNPPPPLGSFKVSFGFQKNKECVTNSQFAPCYVNPEFGRIRGVVLTADRENLRSVREQFTVEKPNDYISIINGGSPNEKKFYEAIFMGSSEPLDCKDKRSSHIIDGKCYPMEIYMYFVDETIPTMALTTILVVQVELGETENPNIRPVVDAVSNLYNEERLFLAKYDHQTRDNRMFHHMGPSSVLRNTHNETDTDYFFIPSSIDVERQITSMMDHFERVQTYKAKTFFTFELYESTKEIENKLVRSAVFQTVPPLKNELLLNTTTNKPIQLPKLLDKLNLTEYQTENPRTVSDLTILKMRLQRYLVTAAYNNHLDHLLRENITLNIPKLDNAWPGAYEGNPMKPNFTFTDLVNKFLNHRYKVEEILKQEGNESSTLEGKIKQFMTVKDVFNEEWHKKRTAMFDAMRYVIEDGCIHFNVANKVTADELNNDTLYNEGGEVKMFGFYPRALRARMDDAVSLAKIRMIQSNALFTKMDETYEEMGYSLRDELNVKTHSPTYLGATVHANISNYTWQNIYIKDTYVNDHLRTFLFQDEFGNREDHPFLYSKYKKTEPRYGKIKYPETPGSPEGLELLLGNLGLPVKDFEHLEKLTPTTVNLRNNFQVSWLLPKGGGYYRYKGSSPVPPCFGAEEVIVFRKPIQANRDQIQALTTIPTFQLKSRDIFNTFGIRHPRRNTNNYASKYVLFDPRNHQFLVGDGVHKNTVLEYAMRKNKTNKAGSLYHSTSVHYSRSGLIHACVNLLIFLIHE